MRRQTAGKKPPRQLIDREILSKGRVEGVRLPSAQARLDEGDHCPNRCGGKMLITPDGECRCHINPPCPACTNSYLQCSECGFEYRNTAEDNMIVDTVVSLWPAREKSVDMPSFALYDIFKAPKGARRVVEVKEID